MEFVGMAALVVRRLFVSTSRLSYIVFVRVKVLTELLASMVVVDGLVDGAPPADPKGPLRAALGCIAECQAA